MAYVTLLSIIPSIAAIISLITLFSPFLGENSDLLNTVKEYIIQHLAAGSGTQVIETLNNIIKNLDLKKIGLTGFAGLFITLILLLRQIEMAFNRVWMIEKPRGIIKRFIYFWTFLTLGVFIIFLSLGILSGFNLDALNPFSDISSSRNIFSSLIPILGTILVFTFLYYIIPNTHVQMRHALIGATPTGIIFVIASKFYGYFVSTFTSYQAIYGALAAIPMFLFWMYLQWVIILSGVVITWRSQQGFFDINESDSDLDIEAVTPGEKDRDNHIKTLLPILVLIYCQKKFETGNADPATVKELSNKLRVPYHWVMDAVESLIFHNFVTIAERSGPDALFKICPTIPTEKLTIKIIVDKLTLETLEWVNGDDLSENFNIKDLIEKVHLHKDLSSLKISDLIKRKNIDI